jgi:hypothetical protein
MVLVPGESTVSFEVQRRYFLVETLLMLMHWSMALLFSMHTSGERMTAKKAGDSFEASRLSMIEFNNRRQSRALPDTNDFQ